MTKKNAAQPVQKSPGNGPNLDSRYGEIGISAVVAALHYKSVAKNPGRGRGLITLPARPRRRALLTLR